MKKSLSVVLGFGLGVVSVFAASLIPAKYAGEFLSGGAGARPLGMGSAYAAVVQDATASYWNPAGLVLLDRLQIHGMHSEQFSGLVNHDFIGAGFSMGKETAVGFGLYRLGVDNIPVTGLNAPADSLLGRFYRDANGQNQQYTPYISKYIHDQEMVFFFSYSRRVSPTWNWGSNIKVIHKRVGDFSAWGLGFDFGLLVFPYRDLRIGFVLQDATSTLIAWDGKRKELITPHIRAGLSYPFEIRKIRLIPALDADVWFEKRKAAAQGQVGGVSFDSHAGMEVEFFRCLSFRAGTDRGRWTLGSGIALSVVRVDYGFMPDAELGNSQRISATIFFNSKRFP